MLMAIPRGSGPMSISIPKLAAVGDRLPRQRWEADGRKHASIPLDRDDQGGVGAGFPATGPTFSSRVTCSGIRSRGSPTSAQAPDALVAFGRPKGDRGSYKQWEEDGIAPQVVFEVLSPNNRSGKCIGSSSSTRNIGVDEYYLYDPDHDDLKAGFARGRVSREIREMNGWTSPRSASGSIHPAQELRILGPDGQPFLTYQEIAGKSTIGVASERDRLAERQRDRARPATCDCRAAGALSGSSPPSNVRFGIEPASWPFTSNPASSRRDRARSCPGRRGRGRRRGRCRWRSSAGRCRPCRAGSP